MHNNILTLCHDLFVIDGSLFFSNYLLKAVLIEQRYCIILFRMKFTLLILNTNVSRKFPISHNVNLFSSLLFIRNFAMFKLLLFLQIKVYVLFKQGILSLQVYFYF